MITKLSYFSIFVIHNSGRTDSHPASASTTNSPILHPPPVKFRPVPIQWIDVIVIPFIPFTHQWKWDKQQNSSWKLEFDRKVGALPNLVIANKSQFVHLTTENLVWTVISDERLWRTMESILIAILANDNAARAAAEIQFTEFKRCYPRDVSWCRTYGFF